MHSTYFVPCLIIFQVLSNLFSLFYILQMQASQQRHTIIIEIEGCSPQMSSICFEYRLPLLILCFRHWTACVSYFISACGPSFSIQIVFKQYFNKRKRINSNGAVIKIICVANRRALQNLDGKNYKLKIEAIEAS